jgi:hypothetical protein
MVLQPLTVTAMNELGTWSELLAQGEERARYLGIAPSDDVVNFVLGLFPNFGTEFAMLARNWRGPTTPLKQAILRAFAEEKTL